MTFPSLCPVRAKIRARRDIRSKYVGHTVAYGREGRDGLLHK
jgi:hypothetical protein